MMIIRANARVYRGRVRGVDTESNARRLLERVATDGQPRALALHGGSVPNSYGYRANTEAVTMVAFASGRVVVWYGAPPANKVTDAGVVRCCIGAEYADWRDMRCGTPRRMSALRALIAFARTIAGPGCDLREVVPQADPQVDVAIECALHLIARVWQ